MQLNCLALENISYLLKSTFHFFCLIFFLNYLFSPWNVIYNTNIIYTSSLNLPKVLLHFTQTDMH